MVSEVSKWNASSYRQHQPYTNLTFPIAQTTVRDRCVRGKLKPMVHSHSIISPPQYILTSTPLPFFSITPPPFPLLLDKPETLPVRINLFHGCRSCSCLSATPRPHMGKGTWPDRGMSKRCKICVTHPSFYVATHLKRHSFMYNCADCQVVSSQHDGWWCRRKVVAPFHILTLIYGWALHIIIHTLKYGCTLSHGLKISSAKCISCN